MALLSLLGQSLDPPKALFDKLRHETHQEECPGHKPHVFQCEVWNEVMQ